MKFISGDITEWQKIGVGLTLFGILFTILGIILMFDKGFIIMGNTLFLSGVALVIGFFNTFNFFFQRKKWKGTGAFIIGLLLVFFGRPFFGMIFEGVGGFILFGHFIPTVLSFIENIPVLGAIVRQISGNAARARLPE